MDTASQLRRVSYAFLASALVNLLLIGLSSAFSPESSQFGRIVDLLGRPGGVAVEMIYPGHSGIQVMLLLCFSILFYAALAWILLWTADLFRSGGKA